MRCALFAMVLVMGCEGQYQPSGQSHCGDAGANGAVSSGGHSGGHSDGGPGGGGGGIDGGSAAPTFKCRDKVASVPDGHHHPGENCADACHDHGFTFGGTLYAGANSTTPVAGATITMSDPLGNTFDIVTQANGNFFTSVAVSFPLTITASLCPDIKQMPKTVTADLGGCNQGGCHVPGAEGRIHIP
jgi:hypothetical protein